MRENSLQTAYQDALNRAQDALLSLDIEACCACGGAVVARTAGNESTIEIFFLNKQVRITLPQPRFATDNGEESVSILEKILILHYLANSQKASTSDTLVNYRSLRDGALYAEAFERRCIQPLLAAFGTAPGTLIAAAAQLGGELAGFGDISVRIPVFPRLAIICCLWKGDAEFGPEAGILFDAGAGQLLCAEDIAVMCQHIVLQLIKNRVS